MLNPKVTKVLTSQLWYLATMGDEPNVVPMGFKYVQEDGKLLIGNVFMKTTIENIEKTGKAAVSVYDPAAKEGYQLKGAAVYVTEGEAVETLKAFAQANNLPLVPKGAVVITPEKAIVTHGGPDNKKEVDWILPE